MSMPTDDEMKKLVEEMPGPITDRIFRAMSEAERRLLQKHVRPLEQKIQEHEGFIARLKRGLGAAVKG